MKIDFEYIWDELPSIIAFIIALCFVIYIANGTGEMINNINTIEQVFNISSEQAKIIYNSTSKNKEIIQYDKYKAINKYSGKLYTGNLVESTYKNAYNQDYIEWYETDEYDFEILRMIQFAENLKFN